MEITKPERRENKGRRIFFSRDGIGIENRRVLAWKQRVEGQVGGR